MIFRTVAAVDALPAGSRIASFEIEAVIARGPSTFVYLAHDLTRGMPVAIKEYARARRVGGSANTHTTERSLPLDSAVQSGLEAFMAEARMLASCHHPSLVRVDALLDAHGTAYRVMPFYKGLSLVHLRTGLGRAPDNATLRAWGSDLVGALQAMHSAGHSHGFVCPENILLLADDRPLLFGAGSASHRVGSNLVASLLADFGLGGSLGASGVPDPELLAFMAADGASEMLLEFTPAFTPAFASASKPDAALQEGPGSSTPLPEALADDLRALAAVLRFCIDGEAFSEANPAEASETHLLSDAAAAPLASSVASTVASPVESPVAPLASAQPASPTVVVEPPQPDRWFGVPANADGPRVAAVSAIETQRRYEPELPSRAAEEPDLPKVPAALDSAPSSLIPQRWLIPLWVGLLALSGVAVVLVMGHVMGAWNRMPPIDFDHSLQSAPSVLPAPSPLPAAVPKAPSRRSAAEPARGTTQPVPPALAPVPALPTSEVENQGAPLLTKPGEAPAAGSAAKSEVASSTAEKTKAAEKDASTQRAVRPVQPAAPVKFSSPLEACGNRTNFSLERCMQTQCQEKKWAVHPQCIGRP